MAEGDGPRGWADVVSEIVRSRWFPWVFLLSLGAILAVPLSTGSEVSLFGFKIAPPSKGITPPCPDKSLPVKDVKPSGVSTWKTAIPSDNFSGKWDIKNLDSKEAAGYVWLEILIKNEYDPKIVRAADIDIEYKTPNGSFKTTSHTTYVIGQKGFYSASFGVVPLDVRVHVRFEGSDYSEYSDVKRIDSNHPVCGFSFTATKL